MSGDVDVIITPMEQFQYSSMRTRRSVLAFALITAGERTNNNLKSNSRVHVWQHSYFG